MEILKVEHLVKQYGKDDNAVLAVMIFHSVWNKASSWL